MPLKAVDNAAETYAKDLEKVLADLDKRLVSILRSTIITGTDTFDATAILTAREIMLEEMIAAGYLDIANKFLAEYPDIKAGVERSLAAAGIPNAVFTTVDNLTFQQISLADFEAFEILGAKAMDDLRQGLYRMAVQGNSFDQMVDAIRESTIGTTAKGTPLANFSRTHANTAALRFANNVSVAAGERLGTDEFEVVGPLDAATRDICLDALSDPIRTKQEWIDAGYWADRGGWNCRHILRPFFGKG